MGMGVMRLLRVVFLLLAATSLSFACANNDDDDDAGPPANHDAADDDDEAAPLPSAAYDPPCAPMLAVADPYHAREAAWFVARFDPNDDSPALGLYAYYWLDWYNLDGCSWSANFAVLYRRDGAIGDNYVSGEFRSGFPVEFGPNEPYDVFVQPRMHVYADPVQPLLRHLDLFAEDFTARFTFRLRHVRVWTAQYLAAYDAAIEEATITIDGQDYHPTGHIDYERWWEAGGYAPGSPEEDFVNGAWLYEPLSWRDEAGQRVDTLIMYWVETDGFSVWTHYAGGVLSQGPRQYEMSDLEWNFNFPENETSGGYPLRHAMTGRLDDGRAFAYEVAVTKEFHDYDHRPAAWADFEAPEHRAAHSLNEGTLLLDGVSYEGGGVHEWSVSDYNPLPGAR